MSDDIRDCSITEESISIILWLASEGGYGEQARTIAQRVRARKPNDWTLMTDEWMVRVFLEEMDRETRYRFVDVTEERVV